MHFCTGHCHPDHALVSLFANDANDADAVCFVPHRFPDLHVVGSAVWRGSLLVALDVAQLGDNKQTQQAQHSSDTVYDSEDEQGPADQNHRQPRHAETDAGPTSAAARLEGVGTAQWLRWLGLPEHMVASVQVSVRCRIFCQ